MKKLISFILVLSMVFASTAMLFATEQQDDFNYVSLGSSQTYGYGFPGFEGYNNNKYATAMGYELMLPDAFPSLMKKYLEDLYPDKKINVNQLAISSFRSNELLLFLDDDFKFDLYSEYFVRQDQMLLDRLAKQLTYTSGSSVSKDEAFAVLKQQYRTAITDAHLITYDLGCGNFGLNFWDIFFEPDQDIIYKNLLSTEEYEMFSKYRTIVETQINSLLVASNINPDDLSLFKNYVDSLTYSFVGYCTSLDRTMDWIYENNPNATVVVMQIQNMIAGQKYIVDGVELPIGDLMNIAISLANNYAASYSKHAKDYLYARITDDQRVRFLVDDMMEYEGPDDLTKTIIGCLELYNLDFYGFDLGQMFDSVYTSNGGFIKDDNYNDAKTNAYDAFVKWYQAIMSQDIVGICTGADEYYELLWTDFHDLMNELLDDATVDFNKSQTNQKAIDKALKAFDKFTDTEKSYIVGFFMADFAGGVFQHPDQQGDAQMAQAVQRCLENNVTGLPSIVQGMGYAAKDIISTTKKLTDFALVKARKHVEETVNNVTATIKTNIRNEINSQIGKIVKKVVGSLF